MMRYRFTALVALAALLPLAACDNKTQPPAGNADISILSVSNAKVRLPAVAGRPAAAYFEVHGGSESDRLESISTPRAATVELHETRTDNGVTRMQPITGVDILPGQTVSFAPGGRHAMLYALDPSITPGTTIPLTFHFQSGATLTDDAVTFSAGAATGSGDAGHQGH